MTTYAALVNKTIHHEGDERSRTNPGHGYPARTKTFVEYLPFNTLEALQAWVVAREKNRCGDYHIIEVQPLTVKTTVTVEVSTP